MSLVSHAFSYPISAKVSQTDDYHGVTVADPYRWLEDSHAEATQAWVSAQNECTHQFLATIPSRPQIQRRLTELWDYERFSAPFKQGGRYFYFKNDGLQNQSVLYTLPDLTAPPQVLLDPNQLAADATVALAGLAISENGQFLAYGLSRAGSDWQEWQVRDIATGADLDDHLQWLKFSGVAWTHDHQGFFYSRYDEPAPDQLLEQNNYYQKLYYHRLGTPQSQDPLIYERPDQAEWGFNPMVSDDGRYLLISVWQGSSSRNLLFYKELVLTNVPTETLADTPVIELIHTFEANFSFIDHQTDPEGEIFWLQTDWQAPRGRVIAVNLRQPEPEHWQEIIPEADETLEAVGMLAEQFMASYLQDAHSQIKVFDLQGQFQRQIRLPGLGSASGLGGKRQDQEAFYSFTSFSQPTTIYRYAAATGNSEIFRQPQVAFDPGDYETTQVFFRSKDGTQVPMFISHKRGLELNGRTPTILYGYGGFNIALSPNFSVANLAWMEMGGIYAVANLRGGSEYGETWHQAGMKANKQNVFDDFIAATIWLINNKYTCPSRLAISGGSNGGLLVGACMTQHPDLFAAALPAVGVMDMLRFHKFTIGWAWVSEYGSADNPEDFANLYRYSPLHNLRDGTAYPATLVTTADHDDRVVPAHSFKFAAALQSAQRGHPPVLIRIETKAGHGAGKPTTKQIAEATDKLAFLVKVLEMAEPD
jgi:prolyl oligopeptidase